MTPRNLEIFVEVAECGRMTEVAKRMFITQSSVSQAISEIEKEYNVLLFERLSKGLYLTEAGKELLKYGQEYLSLRKEIQAFLKSQTKSTSIRVGGTPTVGSSVLSPIVEQLKQKSPGVKVTIEVANTRTLEGKLLKNELDIALIEGRLSHPDLIRKQCLDDRLVLICARDHRFFGRKSVSLADLANEAFILREEGSGTRAQLENQLIERKIPYTISGSCTNVGGIKNAVLYNHGISVLSSRLVQREVMSGILWACQIEDGDFSSHFDLVYHRNKYFSDVISSFVTICNDFGEEERNGTARSRNMMTLIR